LAAERRIVVGLRTADPVVHVGGVQLERFAEADEKVEQGYRVCPTGKGHNNTLTQQVREGVLEMGGKRLERHGLILPNFGPSPGDR
jgi:hypothetical protein